jgi:hypothetical protein
MKTTNCKNCNTEVSQNYCPNCGQQVVLKRIDRHYITHEMEHLVHFERGFLYTIKALLTSPGETVRHFLSENRTRLVKPVVFIILASLIYSIITHFFHIEDGYIKFNDAADSVLSHIFTWIQKHYGYANIMIGVFIALWAKLLFRKYDYNVYEILILLCFVIGTQMLIFAFVAAIQGLTHLSLMQIAGFIGAAYCSWAIGQFFDQKKAINYIKAFGTYILGMITFTLLAIATGTIVDLITKH